MIRIGKIVASHGLQGAVVMTHIVGNSSWLKKDAVLFLEMQKGSFIPFFIAANKVANDDEYIVQFEDVSNAEEAKKLIGRQVYVQEDIIQNHSDDSPLLWIGFNIVDKEKGSIGVLEDVMQVGPQWLGRVIYEGREVLIPLIDQMIIDLNVRNRYIRMELPEGLLEL